MNFLLASTLAAPNDLWVTIINWIQGAISNYGWTILLFTLLVKLATSPLDFMVKLSTKKQTLIQKKCAPEIAKLQKKYGNDQETVKVQTQSLYKREGLRPGIGCLVMLINMILTMVIFFTLYGSLRKVSAYEAINQYEELAETYNTTFSSHFDSAAYPWISPDEADTEAVELLHKQLQNWVNGVASDGVTPIEQSEEYDKYQVFIAAHKPAADAVQAQWHQIKDSWLWIDNVWVADSTKSPFPDYNALKSIASNGGGSYAEYVNQNIDEQSYTAIYNIVRENSRSNNGFFILAVLAGVLSFLSQWISERASGLRNKKAKKLASASEKAAAGGGAMKIMKIVLPIIMVIFVLTSGSSFGIYIISSSIASILLGEIINLIVDAITKKKRIEVEQYLEKEADRLIRKGKLKG